MKKDLTNLSDFLIDEKQIPQEVFFIADQLTSKEKTAYKNLYGSARNYVLVLYYLRFVKGLTNAQIARQLGIYSQNVHNNLYKFGWEYSTDYLENKLLAEKNKRELDEKFIFIKQKCKSIELSSDEILQKALKTKITDRAYKRFGFNTKNEYITTLYYLHFIEDMPPKKLCKMFHESVNVTVQRLRVLGLNKNFREGINGKQSRGSQDYEKTKLHGNITRLQNQIESGSLGTANENMLRSQLSFRLPDILDTKRFDIVVGLPNIGNLGMLETDIPVIIFDTSTQHLYRFAIEWNGLFFHDKARDNIKRNVAKQKGWVYFSINEPSNGSYSNNNEKQVMLALEVCQRIKRNIEVEQNYMGVKNYGE